MLLFTAQLFSSQKVVNFRCNALINDRNKKWTTILTTTKVNIIYVKKKYSYPEIGDAKFKFEL